jgi:cell division septation protein DedD
VQVSSYQAQTVAQKEVDNWNRQGYPAVLSTVESSRHLRWHRVLLGPHPSRALAQALGQALAARHFIGDFTIVDF